MKTQLELDQMAQAGELESEPVDPKEVVADYRIMINGFPKSGTHLIELYIKAIAPPMRAEKPWAGTFAGNSWTETWIEDFRLFRQMGWLNDGAYAKGHIGYRRDIEMFVWGIGASMIFIYRDPRDVAVSQTHHILGKGQHPEREPYREATKKHEGGKGGFKEALKMVIAGYQGKELDSRGNPMYYSGVVDRWRHYAPWLVVPWIMSVKYEDAIDMRPQVAGAIVEVAVARAALHRGLIAKIPPEVKAAAVERMVEFSYMTDKSPTYRKGQARQWERYFDDEIKALWKEHDPVAHLPENVRHVAELYNQTGVLEQDKTPRSWVVRLGYEEDEGW